MVAYINQHKLGWPSGLDDTKWEVWVWSGYRQPEGRRGVDDVKLGKTVTMNIKLQS